MTYGGLTGKTKADFGVGHARYITFLNVLENVVIDPHQCELVRVGPGERQNPVRREDILSRIPQMDYQFEDVPGRFCYKNQCDIIIPADEPRVTRRVNPKTPICGSISTVA